ncbi:MAG: hypothetical protein AB8B74_11085 [Crocinitomicaceae bacterium]
MMRKVASIGFCILLVGLSACKKEQAELADFNVNCNNSIEVSANFLIEEYLKPLGLSKTQIFVPTDTIYAGKNVRFTAQEINADYTWYLGSEVIKEPTFSRFFGSGLAGETIPVSLVVKKKPNTICNPFDDGVDSLTQYMTFVETIGSEIESKSHLYQGNFRLLDSLAQNDSVDVIAEYKLSGEDGKNYNRIEFTNLFGENVTYDATASFGFYAYRMWELEMYLCGGKTFLISHSKEGEVRILMKAIFDDLKVVHSFKGRKIY